jgi:hypothetical protein
MRGEVAHITRQFDLALRIEPLRDIVPAFHDGFAGFYEPRPR